MSLTSLFLIVFIWSKSFENKFNRVNCPNWSKFVANLSNVDQWNLWISLEAVLPGNFTGKIHSIADKLNFQIFLPHYSQLITQLLTVACVGDVAGEQFRVRLVCFATCCPGVGKQQEKQEEAGAPAGPDCSTGTFSRSPQKVTHDCFQSFLSPLIRLK